MSELSEKLTNFRMSSGKSQREFAEMLGIPQTTWSGYEKGKSDPPMKVLFALRDKGYIIKGLTADPIDDWPEDEKQESHRRMRILKEGVFPEEMPSEQAARIIEAIDKHPKMVKKDFLRVYSSSSLPEGFFLVRLLDQQLSAGPGSALPEDDSPKALIPVPRYLSHYGENIAALTVEGDSMYPTLSRGDMVVCDSCGWSGEGVYAVRMGGSGFVKRLTKRPGKMVIISDNPKYPPQEEPEGSEDFEIIGRVHCAITKVE